MSRSRRPRRRDRLRPLGELVKKVYPAPEQLQEVQVFGWWARALPRRVLENARPVRLRNGVLWVHARSAVWAQELQLMSDEILARIRAFAPGAGVVAIRFRVAPLPPLVLPDEKRRPPRVVADLNAIPEELGRELARIGDDELRNSIARAASLTLARAKRNDER